MDKKIKSGWHWTFGWMRRPDYDTSNQFAYEGPDGEIIMSSMFVHRKNMYMAQYEDAETGELYVTDDPAPRVYCGKLRRKSSL